jgi:exopolysaccharide production protein ExoQ
MLAKPMLALPVATEVFLEQRPRWDIRVALMVPCMIYFGAGLNFTSSQDRAAGDALTATAADPSAHRAAVIIAAPFVVWICIRFRSLLLRTLRGNFALLLLLIWAALSVVWSQDRIHTVSEAGTLVGTTLIVMWMAQTIDWQSQLKIILWAGAISGVLSVAFAVALPSRGIDYAHGSAAWQGIFFSKNHLGRMMLFFLTPAFYFRAGPNQTLLTRALRYSYIVLCLGLIGMSRSKTAIAVAAIYLVFTAAMFVSRRLRAMDRKFLILALAILFSVSALMILPNLTALVLEMGGDPTLTGRTVIWSQLLISFWKHPWTGYGYGAFWGEGEGWAAFMRIYGSMHFAASYAHSGYIDVLLQLGGVGLTLIIAMIAKATYTVLREIGGEQSARVEWCSAILFASVIYNVDEVTYAAARALPWIVLLLACLNLNSVQEEPQAATADVSQKELAYESAHA